MQTYPNIKIAGGSPYRNRAITVKTIPNCASPGGSNMGTCIRVGQPDRDSSVMLTRDEAFATAMVLLNFSNSSLTLIED